MRAIGWPAAQWRGGEARIDCNQSLAEAEPSVYETLASRPRGGDEAVTRRSLMAQAWSQAGGADATAV